MPLTASQTDWWTGLINVHGCNDIWVTESGIYQLFMMSTGESKDIYCNMDIDSGGWTVIRKKRYIVLKGNDVIHDLTTDGRNYSLRVDLESYDGEAIFAIYSSFSVGPEFDNYRLHVGGYSSASTASK
ncbi:hypothetical protein LSH36_1054g00009 [Paralvinella palmiformis]|uniref:Fibrinogen C-terminal domain-containing protein n=1 Tax=Paralvinella palmiformis TaxID=53620 RepID=A0AAD9IW81_9ANNE|nr:hypothetical protein LSH36_1054g00009 [Paralvinella palmiformis]